MITQENNHNNNNKVAVILKPTLLNKAKRFQHFIHCLHIKGEK